MPPKGKNTCVWILKVIFSPFILIGWSFAYYLVPCVWAYLRRMARCLFCMSCKCCRYTDKKFPATEKSLGNGQAADWVRVGELDLWHAQESVLFPPKIRASDLQQGGLGNCWLISGFACVAEHQGIIQRNFYTKEKSSRGKYAVRIYDRAKDRWEKVVVDDLVPCKRGTRMPLFACPSGNHFWPILMEKAFAKYCGSYEALKGGHSAWAMEALTGDVVFKMMRERDGGWRRYDLTVLPNRKSKRDIGLTPTQETYSVEKVFDILWEYHRAEALLAASSEHGADRADNAVRGIVQGHAYSILRLKKVDGFQMVQLRNPWGDFEWTGNWSDHSTMWQKNPKVAKALKYKTDIADIGDGVFWMEMGDVVRYFRNFDVCDRSRGLRDLRLDLHEEKGCPGPCYGCSAGCYKFWCQCRGARRLICGHTSTGETREGRTCCICCGR